MNKKGGISKRINTPKKDEKKRERALRNLVRVEYLDHAVCNKIDPRTHKPVLREVVGWLYHEDSEYILIICERPITYLDESVQPEVSVLLIKSAIFGIWDLNSQSLRSRKTTLDNTEDQKNE